MIFTNLKIIQISILVITIIPHVPINNKETNPPNTDAKKPVVLHKKTSSKIMATNPKGINLKINFVSFKHKYI